MSINRKKVATHLTSVLMQLGVTKPELKVQIEVPATKLGSATTVQIANYGITATYVCMESPPALMEQKYYLQFLFGFPIYLL